MNFLLLNFIYWYFGDGDNLICSIGARALTLNNSFITFIILNGFFDFLYLLNLPSKKKIKAIDQKIDAVEFNIEQTKEGIGRCINQIESCEFIINHRTKYINNLLKK